MSPKPLAYDNKVVSHLSAIIRRIVTAASNSEPSYRFWEGRYDGDIGNDQLTANKYVRFDGNAYSVYMYVKVDQWALEFSVEVRATLLDDGSIQTESMGVVLPPDGDIDQFVGMVTRKALEKGRTWY